MFVFVHETHSIRDIFRVLNLSYGHQPDVGTRSTGNVKVAILLGLVRAIFGGIDQEFRRGGYAIFQSLDERFVERQFGLCARRERNERQQHYSRKTRDFHGTLVWFGAEPRPRRLGGGGILQL